MVSSEAVRVHSHSSTITGRPGHAAYSIASESRQGKHCASRGDASSRACLPWLWEEHSKRRESVLAVFGSDYPHKLHSRTPGSSATAVPRQTSRHSPGAHATDT